MQNLWYLDFVSTQLTGSLPDAAWSTGGVPLLHLNVSYNTFMCGSYISGTAAYPSVTELVTTGTLLGSTCPNPPPPPSVEKTEARGKNE